MAIANMLVQDRNGEILIMYGRLRKYIQNKEIIDKTCWIINNENDTGKRISMTNTL